MSSKALLRQFAAEYKRKILAEADACTKAGEVGALMRREGLYSSHLVERRRAWDRGALAGLSPEKRGPAAKVRHPLERRVAEQEHENAASSGARNVPRPWSRSKKAPGAPGHPAKNGEES